MILFINTHFINTHFIATHLLLRIAGTSDLLGIGQDALIAGDDGLTARLDHVKDLAGGFDWHKLFGSLANASSLIEAGGRIKLGRTCH